MEVVCSFWTCDYTGLVTITPLLTADVTFVVEAFAEVVCMTRYVLHNSVYLDVSLGSSYGETLN